MLDLELMQSELMKRHEVISVRKTTYGATSGLEVVVSSGIEFYDEEGLNRVVMYHPEFSIVRDNIRNVRQEHKYFIEGDFCRRLHHLPVNGFCDQFLSMGGIEFDVRKAIHDSDYSRVASLIIADTNSFNVLDSALMHKLYVYITTIMKQ